MELINLMTLVVLLFVKQTYCADPVWDTPNANSASVSKNENINVGDVILELEATDTDGDQLTFSIVSQTNGDHFEIDGSTVKLKTALDYETHQSHALVFGVSDGTGSPVVNSVTFTVNVLDVNDVSPVFAPNAYNGSVQENSAQGVSVLEVTATDDDTTESFKEFQYSIQSGDTHSNFVIDPSSGLISTSANAVLYSNGAIINLVIAATDTANNVGTATAAINVKTNPVFSAPSTSDGTTTANVQENSPADTVVYSVTASDLDNDDVTVTILSQPAGDNFKLVDSQLKVNAGASLDFESDTTTYTIRFRAEDTDGNVVESDPLVVSVTNVNEPPVFVNPSHSLEAEAEVEPPQPIVIMGATDPEGDTITYAIAEGDPNSDFQINTGTGKIETARNIAYRSSPFDLRITATDTAGLVTTGTVVVSLKTAPVLTMPTGGGISVVTIDENTATNTDTGRTVIALTSTDQDGDDATYEIMGQSVTDAFRVEGSNLVTNTLLDYETVPYTYEVLLKVTDDSSLHLSSTGTLSVSITNVNEYSPVFNPTSYTHNLKEQSAVYSNFLPVFATDADRGDTITFSITGDAGPFEINLSTGYLSSNAAIVFAVASSYSLTLTATDSGGLTSTATVDITVIEATNPVFTLPPVSGGFTKEIAEDTAIDTTIYQISANDADGDTLTYVLTQGSPEFALDTTNPLDVKVNSALDYDTAPNVYEVVFEARDQNSATSTATLTVSLSDVNDNAPVFSDTPYTAKALQGQSQWTQVFEVSATDADSDNMLNNAIQFEITAGNIGEKFNMNATTGWITAMDLEYAALSSYELEITARDRNGGDGSLSATTTVQVTVTTKPVFTQPPTANTAVNMDEDTTENDPSIYTLAATDTDNDDGSIEYSIITQTPNTPAENMFSVDSATGQIKAGATRFDADAQDATTTYTLGVRASDGTYTVDSSIVVTVVPVDDEPPVFNPASYTTAISEAAVVGTSVETVTATDLDSDDNSLTFTITGGNDGDAFTMVGRQINTAATFTSNSPSTYTLTVQASDGATPPNTGASTVIVAINRAPVWVNPASADFGVDMNEDVSEGDTVYTLSATDANSDQVVYSITGQTPNTPANLFTIEGANIKAGSTPFDADANGALTSITLGVRAEDDYSTVDSSIIITVKDVNDEDPVFDPTQYTTLVWESAPQGTSVETVTATDADKGSDFNTLLYSIVDGDDNNKFTMTGAQINVQGTLSYETKSAYELKVKAFDGSRSATATVTVSLYTKPIWVAPPQNAPASIDETIGVGETVYTLIATDADGGTVSYTLLSQSPDENMFVLEGAVIKTGSTPFDYDANDADRSYTLGISATSGTDTVDTTLVVNINDVDDEAPVFSPSSYSKPLWENKPVGTSVLTVAATDVDSESITYTLLPSGNDGDAFVMSGNQINVNAALDYGTKNTYALTVRASDGNSNTADAAVTISLNTRPVFTQPPPGGFNKNIPENIDNNYIVYTIAVADEDGEGVDKSVSGTTFVLDGNDVKLAAGQTLDFETISGPFTLTFTATDDSGNAIISDNLVITVTDENDNAPTFGADLFSKTMKSTSQTGSVVKTLVAQDADSSVNNNNVITYSIHSGNTNDDFEISSAGVVTTSNSLTMSTPNYNLLIYAVDGGTPSLTGSTTLTVTVTQPSNPSFTTPPAGGASISIPENQAIDSVIYTIVATDTDGDTLTYRLISTDGNSKFSLTPTGGELKVTAALDFESQTSYTLIFGANDDDGDSSNEATSGELTISIINVNEFTPTFTETSYSKTVSEPFSTGDSVITLTANDGDADATVTYNITAGNTDSSFAISSGGGEITAAQAWPGDGDSATTAVNLTVQATDSELSSTVQVVIVYNTATQAGFALGMLIISFCLSFLL